jgi:thiol-disulfide isomerase/thioredoxin
MAAAAAGYLPEHPKLGAFVPTAPPRPAPALAFSDAKGNPVDLAAFKGKPVILNLWASWCGPCKEEMPSLDRLQSELAGKLAVVAVSEDLGGAKAALPFFDKLKLPALKPYLDPKNAVSEAFGVRGLPTSIVIDKDGNVVGTVEGKADWGSPAIMAALKPLLAEAAVVKSSLR